MASLKIAANRLAAGTARLLFPRRVRRWIIKVLLAAEQGSRPQDAIRWLLGISDLVGQAIDLQSKRWGGGIHIKHSLMDGIHSFFYDRIPPGSRVLDLGCGPGAVADAIAEHTGSQVLGIDMDPESITFARERFQRAGLRFMLGNVFTDIPPGESFDVIVLSSVLEHLENRTGFLRDLQDRFHPAKFLIRVPTFERHFHAALKRELGLFPYTDATHLLEYSPAGFADEMKASGLEVRHLEIRWGDIWAECASAGTEPA